MVSIIVWKCWIWHIFTTSWANWLKCILISPQPMSLSYDMVDLRCIWSEKRRLPWNHDFQSITHHMWWITTHRRTWTWRQIYDNFTIVVNLTTNKITNSPQTAPQPKQLVVNMLWHLSYYLHSGEYEWKHKLTQFSPLPSIVKHEHRLASHHLRHIDNTISIWHLLSTYATTAHIKIGTYPLCLNVGPSTNRISVCRSIHFHHVPSTDLYLAVRAHSQPPINE